MKSSIAKIKSYAVSVVAELVEEEFIIIFFHYTAVQQVCAGLLHL